MFETYHYFSKLIRNISANHDRFKTVCLIMNDIEFSNQFMVHGKKSLSELMIPITLFEYFSIQSLITSIKFIYMTTHSIKYLRNSLNKRDDIEKWKFTISKSKSSRLS